MYQILLACSAGLLYSGLLGILLLLIMRESKNLVSFEESQGLFIAVWLISLPIFIALALVSLTLPIVITIEVGITAIYAFWRKRSLLTLVTIVLLINILTIPALWLVLISGIGSPDFLASIFMQIFIWLVEGLLLFLTQRKSLPFVEALGLSLLLNLVTFLVGLVLPI